MYILHKEEKIYSVKGDNMKMTSFKKRLLVFNELRRYATEDISTLDILVAADEFLNSFRDSNKDNVGFEVAQRPNYYSGDVLNTFMKSPWSVVSQESKNTMIDCEDIFSQNSFRKYEQLNRIL